MLAPRLGAPTVRYVVALLLVAALSTASFLTVQGLVTAQEGHAPAINVAGRQRMLSQRIALLAALVADAPTDGHVRTELQSAMQEMQAARLALLQGDAVRGLPPIPSSGPVWAAYLGPEGVDDEVQRFLAAARDALRTGTPSPELDALAVDGLLQGLNAAVLAHEAAAVADAVRLQRLQLLVWGLTLTLLAWEGLFLFRPMVALLEERLRSLERAHGTIAQRSAQLGRVLEATGDALVPVDSEGRVMEGVSREALALFPGLVPGRVALRVLSGGRSELREALADGVAGGAGPTVLEHEGKTLSIEARSFQDVGASGTLLVVRDVTDALRREAARAREAALARSLDAAAQANRAKSQFLATMSHELRTPLNAIIGYSEILEEDLVEGVADVEDVRRIEAAAHHLLKLVDQVLDLSKVEAGRLEVVLEPIDLHAVLDAVAPQARTLCGSGGNTWVDERVEAPLPVLTDPLRAQQVLLNLLGNAAKFTTHGTVRLRVFVRGRMAWVEVRDDGIGIAPDDLQRVWHEYTQVDPTASRRHGGTGLGLTLSRRLCDLMGLAIELESEEGVGTVAHVGFPLHTGASAQGARWAGGEEVGDA